MRISVGVALGIFSLLNGSGATAQTKAVVVFLVEDAGKGQWCGMIEEAKFNAMNESVQAMMVGTLTYFDDKLRKIQVTETDQTGDWMLYDTYFLDARGRVVKLSRLTNVLPGDVSLAETYSIKGRKVRRTAHIQRALSTRELDDSRIDWRPEFPVITSTKKFPFSGLLRRNYLRISEKSCAPIRGKWRSEPVTGKNNEQEDAAAGTSAVTARSEGCSAKCGAKG